MSLKAQLASDMLAMLNPDEFGEAITYLEPGREAKAIHAVVVRSKPEVSEIRGKGTPAGGTGYGRTVFQLTIANDETTGMTSVRVGQDKVMIRKEEDDETEQTFVVTNILSQDPGAWHLEIAA